MSLSQVRTLIASLEASPTKRKGQNFLIDAAIARKMVNLLELEDGDAVIEVGPGFGALTGLILAQDEIHGDTRSPKVVQSIGIEIDEKLARYLNQNFKGESRFRLIEADILRYDIRALILELKGQAHIRRVKVLGNLPYRISTEILFRFMEVSHDLDRMVFSFQREVANRISAEPGYKDYGIPTLKTQLHCDVLRKLRVPASCFFPRPEVDTGVLLLKPHARYSHLSPSMRILIGRLIDAAFGKRRKTIKNALTSLRGLSYTVKDIEAALTESGIESRVRAEELPLGAFVQLAVVLSGRSGLQAEK